MSVDTSTRYEVRRDTGDLTRASGASRIGAHTPRLNGALVFVLATLTICAVGLLYLVQTSHVAKLGYEASRLQREQAARALENDQLAYEIARYESLPVVERVAREQLGMLEMTDYRFLSVVDPSQAELSTPTPVSDARPSLMRRIWNGVVGQGDAAHPDAEQGP